MKRAVASILLVDDSPLIIDRLVESLFEILPELRVRFTLKGAEALVMIEEEAPDVVLLDIQLQDTNGLAILKAIKQKYPAIVVVILTNNAQPHYRIKAENGGVDAFFDKSTEIEKAMDYIKQIRL